MLRRIAFWAGPSGFGVSADGQAAERIPVGESKSSERACGSCGAFPMLLSRSVRIAAARVYSTGLPPYPPAMTVQPTESILIVDFGSQVTQLIARRVREAGVYSEIAPFSAAEVAFRRLQPKGIIFSGGPASVTEAESPRAPQVLFDSGLPLLGICYGQQTLHQQL